MRFPGFIFLVGVATGCSNHSSEAPAVSSTTEAPAVSSNPKAPALSSSPAPKHASTNRQEGPDNLALKAFSSVEIEKPFDLYLQTNPLLMEVTGAKLIRLANGQRVVVAVASTVLKDTSPQERIRAEKV